MIEISYRLITNLAESYGKSVGEVSYGFLNMAFQISLFLLDLMALEQLCCSSYLGGFEDSFFNRNVSDNIFQGMI